MTFKQILHDLPTLFLFYQMKISILHRVCLSSCQKNIYPPEQLFMHQLEYESYFVLTRWTMCLCRVFFFTKADSIIKELKVKNISLVRAIGNQYNEYYCHMPLKNSLNH